MTLSVILHKHVVILRDIGYASDVANFEVTEIINIFKLEVRTVRGKGTSETCKSVQGGGGPKIDESELTYFLNGPYLQLLRTIKLKQTN